MDDVVSILVLLLVLFVIMIVIIIFFAVGRINDEKSKIRLMQNEIDFLKSIAEVQSFEIMNLRRRIGGNDG